MAKMKAFFSFQATGDAMADESTKCRDLARIIRQICVTLKSVAFSQELLSTTTLNKNRQKETQREIKEEYNFSVSDIAFRNQQKLWRRSEKRRKLP